MDIIRNVGVRENCSETGTNISSSKNQQEHHQYNNNDKNPQPTLIKHPNSLPNVAFSDMRTVLPTDLNNINNQQASSSIINHHSNQPQQQLLQQQPVKNSHILNSNSELKIMQPKIETTTTTTNRENYQVIDNNQKIISDNVEQPQDEECAVSGRLEIRVIPQGKKLNCF